jgi:hypothetical protein
MLVASFLVAPIPPLAIGRSFFDDLFNLIYDILRLGRQFQRVQRQRLVHIDVQFLALFSQQPQHFCVLLLRFQSTRSRIRTDNAMSRRSTHTATLIQRIAPAANTTAALNAMNARNT